MRHEEAQQDAAMPSPEPDALANGWGLPLASVIAAGFWGPLLAALAAAAAGHPWLSAAAAAVPILGIATLVCHAIDLPFRVRACWLRRCGGPAGVVAEYDRGADRYQVRRRGHCRTRSMSGVEFDELRQRMAATGGLLTLLHVDQLRREITLTRHRGGLLHGPLPGCAAIARLGRGGDRCWTFEHGRLLGGPHPPWQHLKPGRETPG